ncbi:MAG: hypothetical protein IKW28_10255 [Lachnospiraceae bacterium]|nr:hypothetical protein [Lachnospiraceae bacterium]
MSLPGTFKATKKDGTIYYRSSLTYKNKHISLGSFSTEEEASCCYQEALILLENTGLSIENYRKESKVSFEKWVILLNFRDNNIYFHTPIYIRKNFFHYYLSSHTRLTFDMDDLFYYSSHKITERKGHLFVADYGMQLTITGRYGIKSYGVEGRDYRFINGDNHDFRYENIEILNTYHGVEKTLHRGKEVYRSKINLKGYFIIGYYKTALEAAIAYNKAIDILKKAGITKNFPYNEMEGISPSLYADLYSKLKISAKIINYLAE